MYICYPILMCSRDWLSNFNYSIRFTKFINVLCLKFLSMLRVHSTASLLISIHMLWHACYTFNMYVAKKKSLIFHYRHNGINKKKENRWTILSHLRCRGLYYSNLVHLLFECLHYRVHCLCVFENFFLAKVKVSTSA